ncbi:MAG: translation elongation factor Ts [Planctomycetota bacterium]
MSISAKDVNELRKSTGAGMMDCKKALQESNGDIDAALEWLRKKGQKVAAKRADRDANEGVVVALKDDAGTTGIVLALSCETDFVAKNENFIDFANQLANLGLEKLPANKEEFVQLEFDGATVAEKLVERTGKIGEKLEVSDFQVVKGDNIATYVHAGSKIGVVVAYQDGDNDEASNFFRSVAMHIAAMAPQIMTPDEFELEFVEKETAALQGQIKLENEDRERLGKPLKNVPQFASRRQLTPEVMAKVEDQIKEELKAENKPEKIWDRIIPGKIERFIADNTLLDQERCLMSQFFVLDESMTVEKAIKNFDEGAELTTYKRASVG